MILSVQKLNPKSLNCTMEKTILFLYNMFKTAKLSYDLTLKRAASNLSDFPYDLFNFFGLHKNDKNVFYWVHA